MLTRPAVRRRDDEGNVIMATTVVMVVTLAIAALLITVTTGLNSARNDQNRVNAFQFANAGIDQAMFRLDQRELPRLPDGNYTPTRCYPTDCSLAGSVVTAFTDSTGPGDERFDVVAEATPDGQTTVWRVRSTGRDQSGRLRQAVTTVSATPIFENGFFAMTNFYTNGRQITPAGYDSSRCPDPRINLAADGCDLTNGGANPVPTRLGSNGAVEFAAATIDDYFDMWAGIDMYGRSTQDAADGDCGVGGQLCKDRAGYPDGWVKPHTNQKQVGPFDMPSGLSCTNPDGTANPTGTYDTVAIPAGDYHCSQLNLSGPITVSGTGRVRIWVDGAVTINPTAIVNEGQPTPRFQIYQTPSGPSPAGSFCGSGPNNPEFWGLLFAPRMQIACLGTAQPTIYGAVIARFYDGPGAHFDFHWDQQSMFAVNDGKYVVRNWRECPPGVTDC